MTVRPPTVFVSYAHESDEHKALVLAFATFLRDTAGVAAVLDLWSAAARQDWYSWTIREMTEADFVLVVASEGYRRWGDGHGPGGEHRGVQSEAALLRELVYGDRAAWLPKILPVVLPGHGTHQIPLFLQPTTASHYRVNAFTVAGAEDLLRVVLGQPGHLPPEVRADRPVLPPHSGAPASPPEPAPRVLNQITGNVTGKVVQADTIQGDLYL
jgi:hypothetical protein